MNMQIYIVFFLCNIPFLITPFKLMTYSKLQVNKFLSSPSCLTSANSVSLSGSTDSLLAEELPVVRTTTYSELITFGLPTLGIWLLQPILSLVDTAVMGMNKAAKIEELAALGPGIAWIDSSAYLCYFLSIATTNLFASALKEKSSEKAHAVLTNALSLALVLGIVLGIVQFLFAGRMVQLLSGSSLASISYGTIYAKVRALAAPVALLTMVTQSAFLAAKDSTTPLKAVIVGALVNVAGDFLLVKRAGLGIAGAAWATTASQYAGMAYLIRCAIRLNSRPAENVVEGGRIGSVSLSENGGRWFAYLRSHFSSLTIEKISPFLHFCGPLFIVLLIKAFLWTFTTFAVAAAGAVDLAAHQIMINFFVMFCIFGDVIAQIAATYLPYTLQYPADRTEGDREAKGSRQSSRPIWSSASNSLIRQISILGLILGLLNSVAGLFLATSGTRFLTHSTSIAEKMSETSVLLALSALPHCLMLGLEGIIVAVRDTSFLSQSYLLMALSFVAFQSYVRASKSGLVGVWLGMATFQWLRLGVFYLRKRRIAPKETL